MKRKIKLFLGSILAIFLVALGTFSYHVIAKVIADRQTVQDKEAAYETYMQKVVYLVGSKENIWTIKTTLPEDPERILWDAEYDMPRVMFLGAIHDSDNRESLWSMNINGTDIKLMISSDEIINMRMSELSISPGGRYFFINSEYEGFHYKCYLYDLKEQHATFISEDKCGGALWTDEDNNAVLFNGWGPVIFTMADKTFRRTNEILQGADDYGIKKARGMRLSIDKTKLIRATSHNSNYFYHNGDEQGPGDFIFYDIKTFEFLEKRDYYPKGCDGYMYDSLDHQYFTCNKIATPYTKTSRGYHVFNIKPPFEKVGEAIGLKVVQLNTLNSDLRHFLFRERKTDESSPINRVKYKYKYNTSSPRNIDFYVSANLLENYAERDFTSFFPPLPTQSEVDEANRRIKEQEKWR